MNLQNIYVEAQLLDGDARAERCAGPCSRWCPASPGFVARRGAAADARCPHSDLGECDVAQPRADAAADPPGIVMAIGDLAVDAALVIVTQVRKPCEDDGVARRGLHELSMPPIPVSIGEDLGDDCSHDVAPAGHLSPVPARDRRDKGVVSGPACADRTGRPCGSRDDRHRARGVSWLHR